MNKMPPVVQQEPDLAAKAQAVSQPSIPQVPIITLAHLLPPNGFNTRYLKQSIKHQMKNKSPADPSKEEFIEFDHEKQEIRIQINLKL